MARREEIIEAAIRLAERSRPGQANLSVRAVAKEAGIGASTLRHYFPTQAAMHEAITLSYMEVAVKDLSIDDSARDPGARLYECCAQFLPSHEHRDLQLDVWLSMHISALGPEQRTRSRRLIEHGHQVTYDCLHRWLGILAEEGHLDPAEVPLSATALFTMLDGLGLHAIIAPERITVDAALEQLKWLIAKLLDS